MPYIILAIMTVSLGMIVVRFLPFVVFRDDKHIPEIVRHFTKILPTAIIPMLIIYSLKETKILKYPYGIPEIIGVASVVILQKLFSNAFLSIIGSTVIYMILVQVVFKIGKLQQIFTIFF